MGLDIIFEKNGKQIKEAINTKIEALQSRLDKRNVELDKILDDRDKVRSYLLRNTLLNRGHYSVSGGISTLYSDKHISSEEVEEINQLCTRVMEIEQEISRLRLVQKHLKDEQQFQLSFEDLTGFGFE
ncbi:hypothetical protein WAF17_07605 [Bernardetia sp. ABR2-2B]|uniref:hypothetical protein n=1 Tax=Bernardetia sp. ABR2-2B TaxID=3127472 RepID=UPI0030D388E3